MDTSLDKDTRCCTAEQIMELETGRRRALHAHYALMVYGYSRIPIVDWLKAQADEALVHARRAGDQVTSIGGHPSLASAPCLRRHRHDIGDILREAREHESAALSLYHELLALARDKDVPWRNMPAR